MNQINSLQKDTKTVSFRLFQNGLNEMSDTDDKPRSIRFPHNLWDAIDEDAKKSKRSAVKQMEAVLSMYYDIENNEIDKDRLLQMRNSQSASAIKANKGVLKATVKIADKKSKKEEAA